MASLWRLLLASLVWTLSGVCAEDARIWPIPEAPAWQLASLMHLQLRAPESETLQLTYGVFPLTEEAGLNQSDRSGLWVRGSLVAAEVLADVDPLQEGLDAIAFLSCDGENATADVNKLMGDRPAAILLYSTDGNACSLEGDDLNYSAIYTMGDSNEAWSTVNTTIQAGGILRAAITGDVNVTSTTPGTEERSGSNSAVAMSILYSITGLITLLFLVIIGTGAIRAHRYPERYGPRSGFGGRPSQSRAKGLARAVLETLPIVKFGDPSPAKPDPSLELESQPSNSTAPDPAMGTRLSAIPEEPRTPQIRRSDAAPMSGAVPQPEAAPAGGQPALSAIGEPDKGEAKTDPCVPDEHLGCSICTEDFTVGEDVRVLPCDHKFHPPCIDPWLIGVSGTCPLCRLDLHAQSQRSGDPNAFLSAPPLGTAETWNDTAPRQQRRRRSWRSSRLLVLNLHRFRNATVDETMYYLRQHRAVMRQYPDPEAEEWEIAELRGRSARLADRLRERFHIRTRAQSPRRAARAEAEARQAEEGPATTTTTTTTNSQTQQADGGAPRGT